MEKVQTTIQFYGQIQYRRLYRALILERVCVNFRERKGKERSISEAHCFADFEACKRERERRVLHKLHTPCYFFCIWVSSLQNHLCEVPRAYGEKTQVGIFFILLIVFFFFFSYVVAVVDYALSGLRPYLH